MTGFSPLKRPLLTALLLLPLLVAWDATGLDMALSQAVAGSAGGGGGFPLRDNGWLVRVLHDGGRIAAALALLAQAVHAALPVRAGTPARQQRLLWLVMTLVGWIVVSWLKSKSLTSCPWDLAAFGGPAQYVGHWTAWLHRVADGAGGRCFPSGHAVAGFAFFSLAFLWQPVQPPKSRHAAWFALAALAAGLVFGAAQVLRGAHFVSHVLWSGWACWLLCALVAAAAESGFSARRPATA